MSLNTELARKNMVENQVRPWQVLDSAVLDALAAVPREAFVAERYRALAFADFAVPIGHGETMLKPTIEGRILQALALTKTDRVLEIGAGSGFLTACLARLAGDVVSVERHADLAESARARLDAHRVGNATVIGADALSDDFEPDHEVDALVVGAAAFVLPERFRGWVRPGGRLFAIVGESPAMQATLYTRGDDSHWLRQSLFETDVAYLHGTAPPRRFTL